MKQYEIIQCTDIHEFKANLNYKAEAGFTLVNSFMFAGSGIVYTGIIEREKKTDSTDGSSNG